MALLPTKRAPHIAIAQTMVCEHTYKAMVRVHTIEAVEAEHSKRV